MLELKQTLKEANIMLDKNKVVRLFITNPIFIFLSLFFIFSIGYVLSQEEVIQYSLLGVFVYLLLVLLRNVFRFFYWR